MTVERAEYLMWGGNVGRAHRPGIADDGLELASRMVERLETVGHAGCARRVSHPRLDLVRSVPNPRAIEGSRGRRGGRGVFPRFREQLAKESGDSLLDRQQVLEDLRHRPTVGTR